MRVVFMGSPEFALPCLRRLIESPHEIVGVFTQPDRPSGRGRALAPPPAKELALANGLPVFQPASVSSPDAVAQLRALAPDIGVIAAYGQILRQAVLDVPPLGILNVHASRLPRWRGAAPVPAAILAGDERTGATVMRVVRALDAGPILDSVSIDIAPDDTTATLLPRVAEAGADLLVDVLPRWATGDIVAREQDEALATYAPQIRKTDALIDWERDGVEMVCRKVRAYDPWPVAYSHLDGTPLRILRATALDLEPTASPGTVVRIDDVRAGFAVVAADGLAGIVKVQAAGGRAMSAADYLRGHPETIGKRLTAQPNA
ncbi:MAG: methionyl-tRNA formyltransferase [Dehalococcoidia bacterium]|nr:MAG: methionyl-tRNA formyltransferase [Dehalococcoidia bacterium]